MATITEIPDGLTSTCALCNTIAPHKCSACKLVSYCCKEHQKQHWPQHKLQCRPFEVKTTGQLGRYLVASREIKLDETLLVEAPLVFGPKIVEVEATCLGCYSPISGPARCPKCLWPVCNPMCPGLLDAHKHAAECIILSVKRGRNCETKDFRYEIITPLRCLLLQRCNPRKWKQIMSMEAHMTERGPKTDIYKEIDENIIRPLIGDYLSEIDPEVLGGDISPEIIHRLCGILDVNALEMRIGNTELIALFPTAYLMAHSCLPNTKHRFNDMRITLSASTNIRTGDSITTMYTHALWGTQARRDHLKATKYFLCCCERCADPTELNTYFSALKCLAETKEGPCKGYHLPVLPLDEKSDWVCNSCSVTLTANEVNHLVIGLGNEVDTVMQSNSGKPSVKELEELFKKLNTLLHPQHYHCYTVCHSLIQLYGHQPGYLHKELPLELLERKAALCRQLLTVTLSIDPGRSRLALYTAVLQYELHSVLIELANRKQDSQEASSYVKEAKSLLLEEIELLKNEPEFSPGAQMRDLAKRLLTDVNNVLKEKFKML